jgi:4-hydroxybenzoate polyprenyltransferase
MPEPRDPTTHVRIAFFGDGHVAGVLRLVHPAPALAVIALSAALGAILAAEGGGPPLGVRVLLTVVAVAGSQILTGALNDWADRERDAIAQPHKPIPSGAVSPRVALLVAAFGALIQVAASAPLGPVPLLLGLVASGSAAAYNLALSRTPLSVLPYLVSFGILPLWVAAGVGVGLERVAAAPLVVGPFAAAAHLANTVRDFEGDARIGSRNLAQVIGRRIAFGLACGLAIGVGLGVGAALLLGGRGGLAAFLLGVGGLVAVAQGVAGPRRLWNGMLVGAVCWTAAWALATG